MTSTQPKTESNINQHHWMLWVAPDQEQIRQLKSWPEPLKQRVLTLHPRQPKQLIHSLMSAVESDFYAMITLPDNILCEIDEWKLKAAAAQHNTLLAWN